MWHGWVVDLMFGAAMFLAGWSIGRVSGRRKGFDDAIYSGGHQAE